MLTSLSTGGWESLGKNNSAGVARSSKHQRGRSPQPARARTQPAARSTSADRARSQQGGAGGARSLTRRNADKARSFKHGVTRADEARSGPEVGAMKSQQ